MTDTTTPPAAPAFAALEAEAHQLDGAAPGQAGPHATNNAAELLDALKLARLMAEPAFAWWPAFAATWSDGRLQAIATAGAEIMERHGLTMGELLSQWGPYLALIGAIAPAGLATWQAIRVHRLELERQERAPRPAPPPPESADGVRP